MTLHDLRIRTKRLRYTGELVEPAMRDDKGKRTSAAKSVRKTLKAAAELQEVLGDHQDACVAEHRIRQLLDDLGDAPDAHVVFVGGRLVERERARAEYLRGRWRDGLGRAQRPGRLALASVASASRSRRSPVGVRSGVRRPGRSPTRHTAAAWTTRERSSRPIAAG